MLQNAVCAWPLALHASAKNTFQAGSINLPLLDF